MPCMGRFQNNPECLLEHSAYFGTNLRRLNTSKAKLSSTPVVNYMNCVTLLKV